MIELILAITLTSALLAQSFCSLWQTGARVTLSSSKRAQSSLLISRTIERVITDYDSSRLDVPPRVQNDSITLASGLVHPATPHSAELRMASGASGITGISLRPVMGRTIDKCAVSGDDVIISHCPISRTLEAQRFEHALLLSSTGASEVIGTLSMDNHCVEDRFTVEESMAVTGLPSDELCYARLLIPIQHIFTIYRSEKNQLRYLGHRGETIIENQPVVNDVRALQFELVTETASSPLVLAANLAVDSDVSFTVSHNSHLKRRTVREMLFNE